jgi:hypothetical protein
MNFTSSEASRLQKYLQDRFGNSDLTLRARDRAQDSVEVLLKGEFIGTVYKDAEDGEVSYDFNMAILDIDLPEA